MDEDTLRGKYYNGEITPQEYVSGVLETVKGDTEPVEEMLELMTRRIYIFGVIVGAGIMGLLWLILG